MDKIQLYCLNTEYLVDKVVTYFQPVPKVGVQVKVKARTLNADFLGLQIFFTWKIVVK